MQEIRSSSSSSHFCAEVPSSVRNGENKLGLGRAEQGCSDLDRNEAEEMPGQLSFE